MNSKQLEIGQGFQSVSFADYRKIEAWGSSALRAMRKGPPARVLWERENPKADTDATRLGAAVHSFLLTPDLFGEVYDHKPEGMRFSTKEGKAWRDDPERAGKLILTHDEILLVEEIAHAVMTKETAWESIHGATAKEPTIVWRCASSGELCKGRPDWIEGRFVYDLKVTSYATNVGKIAMQAYYEGWMHQLAHYRTGLMQLGNDIRNGRLVVVSSKPPHFVFTLEVKPDALDLLEIENIATLKEMRICREADSWPGTPEDWVKIEPPANAMAVFGDMAFDVQFPEEEGAEESNG